MMVAPRGVVRCKLREASVFAGRLPLVEAPTDAIIAKGFGRVRRFACPGLALATTVADKFSICLGGSIDPCCGAMSS